MNWQDRIAYLEETQRTLNKKINEIEKVGSYGNENIHDLKKKRLSLKDEISKLQKLHKSEMVKNGS